MSYKEEPDTILACLSILLSFMVFVLFFFPTYGIRASVAERAFQKEQECVQLPGRVWSHTTSGKYSHTYYNYVLQCKGGYVVETK